MPEEDQGYILVNAMLPDASSLERSDAVMRKVEEILAGNEGVAGYNTITGYSLLTSAYSSNMGFFFVELKEWKERTTPELHANGVVAALNAAFAKEIPEAPGRGLRPAGDSRPRNRRGLHDGVAGPRRQHARLPRRADAALHRGGAQAAGDRAHLDALPRRACRRCTRTSTAARC